MYASKFTIFAISALWAIKTCAYTVAIDIGHSLNRPGAISSTGVGEFHYNRALGAEIERVLYTEGVQTINIPSEATLIERARKASSADLLISIHHDSFPVAWRTYRNQLFGYSVFASRLNRFPRESALCAREIGFQLNRIGRRPSKYHATPVQGENKPFVFESEGVHWFDNLILLKNANKPAILIEAGVIANPKDDALLSNATERAKIARSIAHGIMVCFKYIDIN